MVAVIRLLAAMIKREPAPDERDLMTLEDVAARVGVAVPVIRRRIASGDIPAVRINGTVRVERTALERTLAIIAANYGPP
jgi:excisionase family DNA binding protein